MPFVRKVKDKGAQQPHAKTSPLISNAYNSYLTHATGLPSLDDILTGTGIPDRSILLVLEDNLDAMSSLIRRYFVSQATIEGQVVCVGEAESCFGKRGVASFPAMPMTENEKGSDTVEGKDGEKQKENMQIAFRYETLRKVESGLSSTGEWDISIKGPMIEDVISWDQGMDPAFSQIQGRLNSATSSDSILRLCVKSLGHPMWGEEHSLSHAIYMFLSKLSYAIKTCKAHVVAIVTIPPTLLAEQSIEQLKWVADSIISLHDASTSPSLSTLLTASPFPSYSTGLLRPVHLPTLNSILPPAYKLSYLIGSAPSASSSSHKTGGTGGAGFGAMGTGTGGDVVWKVKRRRVAIEVMVLDAEPEGGEGGLRKVPKDKEKKKGRVVEKKPERWDEIRMREFKEEEEEESKGGRGTRSADPVKIAVDFENLKIGVEEKVVVGEEMGKKERPKRTIRFATPSPLSSKDLEF